MQRDKPVPLAVLEASGGIRSMAAASHAGRCMRTTCGQAGTGGYPVHSRQITDKADIEPISRTPVDAVTRVSDVVQTAVTVVSPLAM